MYHMTKKNIDKLPDVLALDLIVDVHHGDQIRKNRFFVWKIHIGLGFSCPTKKN